MKGEDRQRLRTEILEEMNVILLSKSDQVRSESRTKLMSLLERHRATLFSEFQGQWHRLAEQEVVEACEAYMIGDREKGASLIQHAEHHFKRSFRQKEIKPNFVIGLDGKAVKR